MKKNTFFFLALSVLLGGAGILIAVIFFNKQDDIISPLSKNKTEKILQKYSFENLHKTEFSPSKIEVGAVLKEDTNITSREFYFDADASMDSRKKRVSGLINVPIKSGSYPVVVLIRGFVDKTIFTTGEGTRRTAEEISRRGYITLAPDFLGYGKSDQASFNSLEERFQTYTTVLSLLQSINNLNAGLEASYSGKIKADPNRVGIWGHSNGGHIVLSVLAISSKKYPTVLWNPVSKPFPYSILYFTDEFDDQGKALRKVIADFEKDYDVNYYSTYNYYQWIQAPIQLNQAEDDEEVPIQWSNQLNEHLKTLNKDIEYFTYPRENHNFQKGSWSVALNHSIDFYNKWLK